MGPPHPRMERLNRQMAKKSDGTFGTTFDIKKCNFGNLVARALEKKHTP